MDPDVICDLASPRGRALIDVANRLAGSGADDLALLSTLRREVRPALAAVVLDQVRLSAKTFDKFGDDAPHVLVLPEPLEQSTRHEVAQWRAGTAYQRGVRHVLDAGAGLGSDTIAMARAGIEVTAVESDPAVAELLRANVANLQLADTVTVHTGDAIPYAEALQPGDTLFADPARRADGRRIFDPELCTPPLSWLVQCAAREIAVFAKLSPSLHAGHIPPGWEAQWTSTTSRSGRSVVESAIWSPALARHERRASVLGATSYDLVGSADSTLPVGDVSTYLYEPDGAVLQAELVWQLLRRTGGHLIAPGIGYLTADRLVRDLPAQAFRILQTLIGSQRAIGRALSAYYASDLVVKKRGVDIDPAAVRRSWLSELGGNDGPPLTIILTRRGNNLLAMFAVRES